MIKGTVKLKKVTIGGAIYALSLPGFQTANLTVPVVLGADVPVEGTVVVSFTEPEKPKAAHKKK